jgi:hypothetical protein
VHVGAIVCEFNQFDSIRYGVDITLSFLEDSIVDEIPLLLVRSRCPPR